MVDAVHKGTGDVTGRMEMVQTRRDLVRFETHPHLHLQYTDSGQSASIGQLSIVDTAPSRNGRNTIRQPRSSSRRRDCGSRRILSMR